MTHNISPELAELATPISDLSLFEGNPRKGNIDVIAESLKANGQYTPILATPDGVVLRGNHTMLAAKKLGWTEIAVRVVDVDEETARKIVISDNRAAELATYDDAALLGLLVELDDFEGTGYGDDDVTRLTKLLGEPLSFEGEEELSHGPARNAGDPGDDDVIDLGPDITPKPVVDWNAGWGQFECGPYLMRVPMDAADRVVKAGRDVMVTSLGLDARPSIPFSGPGDVVWYGQPAAEYLTDAELVEVGSIEAHPDNPRQGDVGAIMEMLSTLGQHRAITVNRRNMRVVTGNHTLAAAIELGWEKIAVEWIDVDDVQERRILLADNRTSDKGSTSDAALFELLADMSDIAGTGFDDDDLDVLAGAQGLYATRQATIGVTGTEDKVIVRVGWGAFERWRATIEQSNQDGAFGVRAARLLGLEAVSYTPADFVHRIGTMADVERWANQASKEGAPITESENQTWFVAEHAETGEPATWGAITVRGEVGRIKAVFCRREFRGLGIGDDASVQRLRVLQDMEELTTIEAFARDPRWYERHQFTRAKTRPNGGVHMLLHRNEDGSWPTTPVEPLMRQEYHHG